MTPLLRLSEAFQSSGLGADENFGIAVISEVMLMVAPTVLETIKQRRNLLKITKIFRSTPLWRMLDCHQSSVPKGVGRSLQDSPTRCPALHSWELLVEQLMGTLSP